jgi:putative DNA primase/helicase
MLTGKLLNYASEISTKLDTPRFKQLVSGEPIEARQIYGKPFILENYARMMFNTNVLPKDIEVNMGFFRRFILLHFDQTISEQEKDPNLANEIIENELSGVFNWVLEGLERLLAQGNFSKSAAIDNALENYKLNSDTVYLFLEDANYRHSDDKKIQMKILYQDYKEYCTDSGYISCSSKTFGERLRYHQYEIDRKSVGRWVYIEKANII